MCVLCWYVGWYFDLEKCVSCHNRRPLGKKKTPRYTHFCRSTHPLYHVCFVHPIFPFWFLVTFGNEVTKIWKYYVIFVNILQGKMDKTEKYWKENHATKVTKIPKTKKEIMGWTKLKSLECQDRNVLASSAQI